MSDDLVRFMRARLDEDERGIRECLASGEPNVSELDLEDVRSDRALLDAYAAVAHLDVEDPEPEFAYGRAAGLGLAVRHRARRHSHHRDYRREWRP